MTTYIAANNARAKLSAGLGGLASDVTVTISGVDASKFPAINNAGATTAEYSYLTLQDAAGHVEHMKISRHDTASASLTVVRGTAAGIVGTSDSELRAWSIGDSAAITLNAQLVNDAFVAAIQAGLDAGSAVSTAGSALLASSGAVATANAAIAALFPSGTRMPFAQSAAPTGWTQDTSDNAANRMLRVVNTVNATAWPGVVTIGGSASPILNNVVPSHQHTFTTAGTNTDHIHGISDSGHQHGFYWGQAGGPVGPGVSAQGGNSASNTTTGYANLSCGGMTTNQWHAHTGTADANAGAGNWTPRYIDMIICSKI